MADPIDVALVVNPVAGRGRVGRELPALVERLDAAGVAHTVLMSQGPGHAVELAAAASVEGFDVVAAVGGDGTVNEVVNGLVSGDRPVGSAALGVVAAGSGADFARTFGLPKHTADVRPDAFGTRTPLDVGRIVCDGPTGRVTRYFVNVAEAGLGAAVVARAARLPRRLGRTRYLIAFWPTLARFAPCNIRVSSNGASIDEEAHNVVIANARYFGGGMHISPHSDPADGELDVQVSVGPKRQAFTLIPKIYRGRHLPDERILEMAGARISVDADRPLTIEADGELVGNTPATFTALPGLLSLAT
jgi:YegS/Rv2252/BmrU family lipid kinase